MKKSEEYVFDNPKIHLANLIIGDTYIEPQGTIKIVNLDTQEVCQLEFKKRGWSTSNKDLVFGIVTDSNSEPKYHIVGKYTHSLDVIDLEN